MKGTFKLLALKYLSQEDLSGTEILGKIEEGTGWKPSPGTLYPSLEKLEEDKLLESRKEGRKRTYTITEKGEETLENFQEEQEKHWSQVIQSLRNYSEMFDQEELEDMIEVLQQIKDGEYEKPYPIMISYRIIDLLNNYNNLEEDKKQRINKIMENTLQEIKGELK